MGIQRETETALDNLSVWCTERERERERGRERERERERKYFITHG